MLSSKVQIKDGKFVASNVLVVDGVVGILEIGESLFYKGREGEVIRYTPDEVTLDIDGEKYKVKRNDPNLSRHSQDTDYPDYKEQRLRLERLLKQAQQNGDVEEAKEIQEEINELIKGGGKDSCKASDIGFGGLGYKCSKCGDTALVAGHIKHKVGDADPLYKQGDYSVYHSGTEYLIYHTKESRPLAARSSLSLAKEFIKGDKGSVSYDSDFTKNQKVFATINTQGLEKNKSYIVLNIYGDGTYLLRGEGGKELMITNGDTILKVDESMTNPAGDMKDNEVIPYPVGSHKKYDIYVSTVKGKCEIWQGNHKIAEAESVSAAKKKIDEELSTDSSSIGDARSLTRAKYEQLRKDGQLEAETDIYGASKNLVDVRWHTGKRETIEFSDSSPDKAEFLRKKIDEAENAGKKEEVVYLRNLLSQVQKNVLDATEKLGEQYRRDKWSRMNLLKQLIRNEKSLNSNSIKEYEKPDLNAIKEWEQELKELENQKDSDIIIKDAFYSIGSSISFLYRGKTISGRVIDLDNSDYSQLILHVVNKDNPDEDYMVYVDKKNGIIEVKDADTITNDPLTDKGKEVMAAMVKEYGEEEGKKVFYSMKQAGKLSGVDTKDDEFKMGDRVKVIGGAMKGQAGKYLRILYGGDFATVLLGGSLRSVETKYLEKE